MPRFAPDSPSRLIHALALVVLRALLLFGFPLVLLPRLLAPQPGPFAGPEGGPRFAVYFVSVDLLLCFGVGLLGVGRLTTRELGWHRERLPQQLLGGVAGFVLCAAAILVATLASGGALLELTSAILSTALRQRALFAAVGLSAALVEESIYRGYLQPALGVRLGRIGGLLIGATVFAVLHLDPRPASLATKLCTGLVFGVLRERAGSLVAPAVAHALIWIVFGAA